MFNGARDFECNRSLHVATVVKMTHILEGLNFNYNFQLEDEQPPLFSLPFAGTKYYKERRDPGCWRRAPRRESERTFAGPLAGICSLALPKKQCSLLDYGCVGRRKKEGSV